MSRILVVEDEKDIAELIAMYLHRAGHTVEQIGSGATALVKAKASPPDLIVLDLMLPGMDGLLVCQALRADPATAAIPVIAVTASVMASDRRNIVDAGFDGYVGKPLNLKEFLEAVAAAVKERGA